MRGAMCFRTGVTFCSSKHSMKLYESPVDKQHNYEQNLKIIMRQVPVDVRLSIARASDLLNDCIQCELHCYNSAHVDDLATQRTRSSFAIVLSYLIRNILISTHEILIFWENGLLNGSDYHLLEMIHYIPSQWPAFQNTKVAKTSNNHCSVVKSGKFGYKKISSLVLTCIQSSIIETVTF